ncbi:MAG: 3-phosphoshikimate 1-carboxyvinyltransferase [Firmicutes bacterium]|nr:3-phosphoshikimate 1-carboxyvinyltransferase [Bacillota bacterium]
MIITTAAPARLQGELVMPGDKSISHRAALIGSLARGDTEVQGFLAAQDCLSTLSCLRALGVSAVLRGDRLLIRGGGGVFTAPRKPLDAGNSGTTARLLLGVLAAQQFETTLTGDPSLRKRPMDRVVEPLKRMGAQVEGDGTRLPLRIRGGNLKPLTYTLPVASAQVKSALLLAGLQASGLTVIEEPFPSRNHTELMFEQFGVTVAVAGNRISIEGKQIPVASQVRVPGDISAAAFFLVAGAIVPRAVIKIKDVGINPTRRGIVDLLMEMGADIQIQNRRFWGKEEVADLLVRGGAPLRAITVGGDAIPRVIDEIPILAVAAAHARGVTVIRDAAELRVKESDRIAALARELAKLGAEIEERPDGLVIEGGRPLTGAVVESGGDHRMAMALAVAGLAASGKTTVRGAEAIKISFPAFLSILRSLTC